MEGSPSTGSAMPKADVVSVGRQKVSCELKGVFVETLTGHEEYLIGCILIITL